MRGSTRPRGRASPLTAAVQRHGGPLVLFACAAIGWTWPLARHLTTAIPGDPGDNYSFLWNLWWMRHVRSEGVSFFRTDYLLYPMGTSLVDHPHTWLPAWIAATALGRLSVITAQDVLLLVFVFGNMAAMYALAWDLTRHRRAAVFAALVFGLSPYFAAHLRGHFDLVAAWTLPLFVLALRHMFRARSVWPACAAGLVLVVTTYTAYYYTVYLGLLGLAFLAGGPGVLSLGFHARRRTRTLATAERTVAALLIVLGSLAAWITFTGGGIWRLAGLSVSARTPQNVLSAMWVLALAWLAIRVRPVFRFGGSWARRDLVRLGVTAAIVLVGTAPLIWSALALIARGEYVSQTYYWRSGPPGVDAIAPLLGSPFHPLTGSITSKLFADFGFDPIEGVGWIGLVPLGVLLFGSTHPDRAEARRWWIVLGTCAVWALGPILTAGGFDTGLRLPEMLARFVPIVSNAREPGRAMVVVYLAIGVLAAMRLSAVSGRWSRPARQWMLVALLLAEFTDAPIALTRLDQPAVYQQLAAAPPGPVCEVPFGIGDGLGGVGSQERRSLYYATIHQHRLVGGYIGRLPPGTADQYARMPVVSTLLQLSSAPEATPEGGATPETAGAPCRYLVVDRETASAALRAFVESLPVRKMASDDRRDLYRLIR